MKRDAAVFFRQLATAVRAGIPLPQGLGLAATACPDERLKGAAADVERRLRAGSGLATAVAAHPEAFSEVEIALVAVGEEHGVLDANLMQLAERSEAAHHATSRFVLALAYPVSLLLAAILLPPLFVLVTRGPGAYLLTVTRAGAPFVLVLGGIAAAVFLFRRGSPERFDQLLLRLPFLGPNLKKLALARFGESLSALYEGGVEMRKSLSLAIRAIANRHLESRCAEIPRAVERGATLAEALGATTVFPAELVGAVAVGEKAGELGTALGAFARLSREEADRAIGALLIAIPVAIYLLVALYIAVVVISAFGSYFKTLGGI